MAYSEQGLFYFQFCDNKNFGEFFQKLKTIIQIYTR
jgi:hypothetical protein